MDIDLLKTFLEVHRTRHFGQAAENLFVSQSAVSARIKLLEDTLGVPVFTRKRRDIQLTPMGKKLLRYAENIVTTWNRARLDMGAEHEHAVSLAVGGVPSLWDTFLQSWTEWVYAQFPDVYLNAEATSSEIILRRLQQGTLDIGFLFDAPQMPELEVQRVMTVPLVLVASREGLTVEQALGAGYILVDWGTSFGVAHAQLFADLTPPRLRLGLGRLARDFLLARGGAAYLAEPMVESELGSGRLFRVADAPVIERTAHAVYPLGSDRREITRETLGLFSQKR